MKKPPTRTEALLHPVRARLVVLLQNREQTATQLARALGDVPTTTLYRHLSLLLDAGLIEVASTTAVYGAKERTFRLIEAATYLNAEQDAPTAAEVTGLVNALTEAVRDGFSRYLRHTPVVNKEGEVSFVVKAVYLTAEEQATLRQQIRDLVQSPEHLGPGPGKTRRLIGFFAVPDEENADDKTTQ